MAIQQSFRRRNPYWRLLPGLVLLLTLVLAFGLAKPALAATTTIADQASCVAFGGTWQSLGTCTVTRAVTIAAGDTVVIQVPTDFDTLTNNGTLTIQAAVSTKLSFTNKPGGTVNVANSLSATQFINEGVINITGSLSLLSRPARNQGGGQITIKSGATLTVRSGTGFLENNATITIECGGTMLYDAAGFSGNLPKQKCIRDQASCVAFGGTWQLGGCTVTRSVTIAAGDALALQVPTDFDTLTNNGVLTLEAAVSTKLSFTNNAGGTVTIANSLSATQFTNEGVINITGRMTLLSSPSLNRGAGQITVKNGATLTVRPSTGVLTNNATITIECGGTITYDAASFNGNPPKDNCLPSVTINQAADQVDPAGYTPIRFAAVFRQAVTGFTATDVRLGGTANLANATVTISGGPSNYTISVSGVTGNGTVTASIPANAVTDAEGQGNPASTSTDNSVTFTVINAIADQASCVAFGGTWQFGGCTVSRSVTIAAGDTLVVQVPTDFNTLTNNGTLTVKAAVSTKLTFTNNTGGTVNVADSLSATQFVNEGAINITGSLTLLSSPSVNRGAGQITVKNGGTLTVRPSTGVLTNNATITIECGGTITYDAASFSGNPPKQNCTSTVVRDQATCVAAGGSYTAAVRECVLLDLTVAANNIFELTSSTTLSRVTIAGLITNNGMFKTNNVMVFSTARFDNKGTMTLASRVDWNRGSIQNNGTITIQSVGRVTIEAQAVVTNNGAITVACGGSFTNNSTYTGALPQYIDCTAPTATPRQSPAATAGWTNSDVTVFWTWRDNTGGSGLDTTRCTQNSTSSGEGVQTLIATCQDKAGNVGSASYTVKIDKTPPAANPTLSPAPNAAGWNNSQPVTVNWNWTDSGSGIINGPCETSSSATSEGVQTLTAYCIDEMENYAEASYTVKIDRVLPLIVAKISPSPSSFGWYPAAVTVSFTCQEATGSGLASNTVGGNVTLSNEGSYPAVTNTGSCADNAGHVAQAVTVGPFNIDLTKPTISAAATTAPNANGWYNSNVTVRFTCADALSGIAFCAPDQGLSSEGSAVSSTAQTARDKAQNVSSPSNVVTVKLDKTAPVVVITGVTNGATYAFGSVPTTACSTSDALSGVATQATLALTDGNGNGSGAFTATCSGATDLAGNSAAPVSVNYTVGAPPPTATLTNTPVPPTATPTNTPVPPTETPTNTPVPPTETPTNTPVPPTETPTNTPVPPTETPTNTPVPPTETPTNTPVPPTETPTNTPVTPTETPTNTPVPPTETPTNTPVPPTETPTNTPVPPTETPTNTPVPPTETPTNTLVPPTETPTNTPVPPTETPTNTPALPTETPTNIPVPPTAAPLPAGDVCTTMALRDDFNRADGDLGGNWAGLTDQSFFKLAGNQLDVQLGGAVAWKPTTFGVNQAAAVTLSTLDPFSPAQGVLLKVQSGTIPNAGAIAVVYDSLAKAVRVSTLRLNVPAWSAYPNVPATFVNGDKLGGCVQANGTVGIYQNNSLLTTVTLNAEDQSFFNAKGGKIGLWTVAATNALFDDFGGGALAAVTSAAVGEQVVPDEVADDGAALVVDSVLITASVPAVVDAPVATTPAVAPVDATTQPAPDTSEQNQRIFLPIITNVASLAGAALGGAGSVVLLVVVGLVVIGLIWQRRQRRRR